MFTRLKDLVYIWLFSALWLTQSGCRKDEVSFTTYPSSLGQIDYLLASIPSNNSVTLFTLNSNGQTLRDTVLTTPGGVRVFLIDTDFLFTTEDGSAQPCKDCNVLKVEVTDVADKSDWLSRRLPAYDPNGVLLDHTRAIRIRVVCDGKALQVAPDRYIKVQLPANGLSGNMSLAYYTPKEAPAEDAWEYGENASVFWAEWSGAGTPATTVSGYELLVRKLGWVAGVRPLPAVAYSTFCISLPLQFDAENTLAFIAFDGVQTIAEMQPNGQGAVCIDNAPVGYSVRILTVSKAGPVYWLGYRETETATDAMLRVTPAEKSEPEIRSAILSL